MGHINKLKPIRYSIIQIASLASFIVLSLSSCGNMSDENSKAILVNS